MSGLCLFVDFLDFRDDRPMPLHIHDVYATCLHIDTFTKQGDIRDGYTACAVSDCQECYL
jgi:hypothetical protein